jgi:8-oxo-dGTP pyrophosphatase MutT (NUDIX family)
MDIPPHRPWQRLSRRAIYENAWISVQEDQVINPRGGQNQYGLVLFKNYAIGIVPLDEEGYTWLVGQPRYSLGTYSWEIPMGGGPKDRPMLESARRELREETGLLAERWEELLRIHTSNSVTDELGIAYLATGLAQGPTDFDETEDLAIRRLPLAEAVAWVMQGHITDSLSVAALLKAARLMGI